MGSAGTWQERRNKAIAPYGPALQEMVHYHLSRSIARTRDFCSE